MERMFKDVVESPIERRSVVMAAWRMMERLIWRTPTKGQRWRDVIAKRMQQWDKGFNAFNEMIADYKREESTMMEYIRLIKEKTAQMKSSRKAKKATRGSLKRRKDVKMLVPYREGGMEQGSESIEGRAEVRRTC